MIILPPKSGFPGKQQLKMGENLPGLLMVDEEKEKTLLTLRGFVLLSYEVLVMPSEK